MGGVSFKGGGEDEGRKGGRGGEGVGGGGMAEGEVDVLAGKSTDQN